MFIDKAKIVVRAGNGGNGCTSFYSDKRTRYEKPDGGDGGDGGNVIVRASQHVFTLLDLQYRHEFKAASGKHGSGNNRKGKRGEDKIILVPVGTQIIEEASGCLLEDVSADNQEVIIAKGGHGGWGNCRTRKEGYAGKAGEVKTILFDLKLIADVGIVGFPNAGKSTLISQISSARPKIASYPFTTKEPFLGVVTKKEFSFSIVDIPGLIEGAHRGRGLGDKFLRHVERTKILVHLVDMAGVDARDPLSDFEVLNRELAFYSKEVAKKPQIVVANKIDLAPAKENMKRFKRKFGRKIFAISAKEKTNLNTLIDEIIKTLSKTGS